MQIGGAMRRREGSAETNPWGVQRVTGGVSSHSIAAWCWWATWVFIWGKSWIYVTFHIQKLMPDDIKD